MITGVKVGKGDIISIYCINIGFHNNRRVKRLLDSTSSNLTLGTM